MTDDEEIVLSNSSIGSYWKCHHRYFLDSVLRLPAVGSLSMALGSAVHAACEAVWGNLEESKSWPASLRDATTLTSGTPVTPNTERRWTLSPNTVEPTTTPESRLDEKSELKAGSTKTDIGKSSPLMDGESPNTSSSWSKDLVDDSPDGNPYITKTGTDQIIDRGISNSGSVPHDMGSGQRISPARIAESLTALAQALRNEWTTLINPEVSFETALQDGEAMLATYMHEVVPTFHPTMTERPFTIRAEGTMLTGIIDAADEKTDEVHDTKTTALISKFRPESYQVQMTLYNWGYTALTGRSPKRLLLDVLTRGGRVKYRQIEIFPSHGEVRNLVAITRDAILARDFSPTGAINGACHYCPYKEVCEFSNGKTEGLDATTDDF